MTDGSGVVATQKEPNWSFSVKVQLRCAACYQTFSN